MARWISAGVLLLSACGFQAVPLRLEGQDAGIPDGPPRPTGAPGTGDDVVNVELADQYIGVDDLTIATPITIDTGAMALGMPLPPGATFAAAKQDHGPELAILHVRALAVHADVRAFGARALVVIADSFELTHKIDVSAHGEESGPGARSEPGDDGGADVLAGGAPGSAGPTLLCQAGTPGGGGGALEIYARTRIEISGYIDAGGGTGSAGACLGSLLAPNPGGSGGTIVLQSPVVENSGRLFANGGKGGGVVASGAGDLGHILMFYKDKVSPGATTPAALTLHYPL